MNSNRIGIIGGMSYASTVKYYVQILEKYFERKHDYNYPEVIIFSLNFQKIIDLEYGDNRERYIEYLLDGITTLEQAGVSFIAMAANSPHAVYDALAQLTKVPLISIVKATAEKARQENMKKLLLLGIKYTMQSTFYQNFFAKEGIEVITPTNEEQDRINRIILEELVIGLFKDESKYEILCIINKYKTDGVILGCTELPLIISQEDVDVNVLDTLDLHINAILNYYFKMTTLEQFKTDD
jgi:aspartate racemase